MNEEKRKQLFELLAELADDDLDVDVYEGDYCEDEYPHPLPDDGFAIMLADQYALGIDEAAKRLLRKMKNCSDELRIIFDIKLEE